MKYGDTLFVVVYVHKWGRQLEVFSSFSKAEGFVKNIMNEWIDDVPENIQKEIQSLLKDGNIHTAITMWQDNTMDKFSILERPLR